MSLAFKKERDDAPEPRIERRPAAARPQAPADRSLAGFGARVTVSGAAAEPQAFTIVADDEVDIRRGRVGLSSPLAQALTDARVGDSVVWHRPLGDRTLRVENIEYDNASPA
jgi:transcription elongation factor GreB